MTQMSIGGKRGFKLDSAKVTITIERIANNSTSGISNPLEIRLYALESTSGNNLKGHVVASTALLPISAGTEKIGFEETVPISPFPDGYFYPALTLAEQNNDSPNGWFIVDIYRFPEPIYFGKRVALGKVTFETPSSSEIILNVGGIQNKTLESTGPLRTVLLLTKEPYKEAGIKGIKLDEEPLVGLEPGEIHQQLKWQITRPDESSQNQFLVIFLEEQVQNQWLIRDYFSDHVPRAIENHYSVSETTKLINPFEELNALVGLTEVKKRLRDLDASAWRQQELRRHGYKEKEPLSLHMCFIGSPGTGKTTVARIVGQLLAKNGLLQRGHFKEVSRVDLVAQYLGQTSHRTDEVIKQALGGVLFIDEAYTLSDPTASGSGQDYGREAIGTLIQAMENHRDNLCVIFAGYTVEMEKFLSVNSGVRSRIAQNLKFPDFSEDELIEIFQHMVTNRQMTCEPAVISELKQYLRRLKSSMNPEQFGNARSVRNILDRAIQKLSNRVREISNVAAAGQTSLDDLLSLKICDFSFFSEDPGNADTSDADIERNLLQKLQERLEYEIESKDIDPERVDAMQSAIDEFSRRGIDVVNPSQYRLGLRDRLRNEMEDLTQRIGTMRGITHSQLENTKNPSYGLPRPPAESRAAYLRELFWPMRRTISEAHLVGGLQSADNSEAMELTKQTSETDKQLHVIGSNDEHSLIFEESRLRAMAERVRIFTARKNLLIANPIWGNPKLSWSPNTVYYKGRSEIKDILAESCAQIRMQLTEQSPAFDAAMGNFAQLVRANVCVFDMAEEPGYRQAAVAYSLGIAMTLGKPIIILKTPDSELPFDVNLPAVTINIGEADCQKILTQAVEQACYLLQGSASNATVNPFIDEIEAKYGTFQQKAVIAQSLSTLRSQRANPDWLMVANITQQMIRFQNDENRLLLLRSRYPMQYNKSEDVRLFHVMPFSYPWSNEVMETAFAACAQNGTYIRGDRVVDPNIIESIWDELCSASHVLVDLTGCNSNVALELGVAHCMGKYIMLTRQKNEKQNVFDEIAKFRIQYYVMDDLPALRKKVIYFLTQKQ